MTLFDKVVRRRSFAAQRVRECTSDRCHLTIFKCQPRSAGFPTMLEWPLCMVCFIFCFVLSLFHPGICFSSRFFLFCQGRRHYSRVTSYRDRYFYFGRKIFVRHLVQHTGVFFRTFRKNVLLSDKSDEFRQHCIVFVLMFSPTRSKLLRGFCNPLDNIPMRALGWENWCVVIMVGSREHTNTRSNFIEYSWNFISNQITSISSPIYLSADFRTILICRITPNC